MKDRKISISTTLLLIAGSLFVGYWAGKIITLNNPTAYIFDTKSYFENKVDNFESVYVAGTLTGSGIGYKDNTTAITCYKDKMECLVNSVEGISENSCQISRLDSPISYPVIKWDDSLIVASTENPYDNFSCSKTTINIDRKSKVTEWVQEPINQSVLSCKNSDNKTYKWTIEDPSWMKK